ncbi:MAG TPA: hypothetical protein VHE13_13465 [Opitutus sp.]|nr:hypothetical protein [Opitutus sp.]
MHPPASRPLAGWLPALAAAAGAVVYLWLGWCAFPASNWNELRLAPTFALVHGTTVYPPADGGPLSTWIYGPVGLLANLPATLASSATVAVGVAGAINLLVLVAPLAVLSFGLADLKADGGPPRVLALALAVLLLPATSLQFQVADHAAIALGLLACFCLARAPGRGVLAAAALGVLAVGAKQTAVFLIPAQAAWLLAAGEGAAARRYVAWCLVLGAALFIVAGLAFGFPGLLVNLVQIPARLPWGDIGDKLARRALLLALHLTLPWLLLFWLHRRWHRPDRSSASGRLLGLAAFAGIALAPIGLVSLFKIGGDVNMLHWWFYLMPALVAAWLAVARPAPRAQALAVAIVLLARVPEFRSLPVQPQIAGLHHAERIARANPGRIWFPYNPLVTWFTDRRFYHVEDGIATRHLAGRGLREPTFRRHLPARLTAIVYPAGMADHFALQLLPEFSEARAAGAWIIYTRPPK